MQAVHNRVRHMAILYFTHGGSVNNFSNKEKMDNSFHSAFPSISHPLWSGGIGGSERCPTV